MPQPASRRAISSEKFASTYGFSEESHLDEFAKLLLAASPRAFWNAFKHRIHTEVRHSFDPILAHACAHPAVARLVIASARPGRVDADGYRRSYGVDRDSFWKRKGSVVFQGICSNPDLRPGELAARTSEILSRMAGSSASCYGYACSAVAAHRNSLEALEAFAAALPVRSRSPEEDKLWTHGRTGFDSMDGGDPEGVQWIRRQFQAFAKNEPFTEKFPARADRPSNFLTLIALRARAERDAGFPERADRYSAVGAAWIDAGATPSDGPLAAALADPAMNAALLRAFKVRKAPSFFEFHRSEILLAAYQAAPPELAASIAEIDALLSAGRGTPLLAPGEKPSLRPTPKAFALLAKAFDSAALLEGNPDEAVHFPTTVISALRAGKPIGDRTFWFASREKKVTLKELAQIAGDPGTAFAPEAPKPSKRRKAAP